MTGQGQSVGQPVLDKRKGYHARWKAVVWSGGKLSSSTDRQQDLGQEANQGQQRIDSRIVVRRQVEVSNG